MQNTNPKPVIDAVVGLRNQPNGFVGIESDGSVLGTFASRRGTYDTIKNVVLANGELAFTTDTKDTFVGDGVTAGGVFLSSHPKFVAGSKPNVTLTVANGKDINNAIVFNGCSPGVYRYEVQIGYGGVSGSTDPRHVAFWIVPSDWAFPVSSPYPPGIYPDILGWWQYFWNDGSSGGSEFPYVSFPVNFNAPTIATAYPAFGMYGKLYGYIYHNDGPSSTSIVENAPLRSLIIQPFRNTGAPDPMTIGMRFSGFVQRIK